ncbi:MAG: RNA polymerase sigma factor [Acidimicrobiales bacterium]
MAQDALLKAWQALPTFRGESPLKNWLLRITHNTAISALTKAATSTSIQGCSPRRPTPQSDRSSPGWRRPLPSTPSEAALGRLDELSRAIVVLREVEGLSYDEIAQVLDVALPP